MTKINSTESLRAWNYYLDELWNAQTDTRVTDLPIINSGPWLILLYMASFLAVSTRISRSMEKRQEGYFMKPVQIVYYGFFFGIHGIAIPILLTLSKNPMNAMRCSLNELFDLRGVMFIYAGFLYLVVKLINCFDVLILLWTKASAQVTFGLIMETVLNPFVIYGAIKYYPGGIVYFPIVLDCLTNSVKYGLSTRACASASIKPINNWEQLIHYIKIGQYALVTLHSIYSLTIQDCDCPLGLRCFFAALHFFLAMAYSFDGGHFFYSEKQPSSSSSSNKLKRSTKVK